MFPWMWLFAKSPEQAAQTIVYMSVAHELQQTTGAYFKLVQLGQRTFFLFPYFKLVQQLGQRTFFLFPYFKLVTTWPKNILSISLFQVSYNLAKEHSFYFLISS